MLQLMILFCSLIAASAASCNQTCGGFKVPFPFGFSASCHIQLSCNSSTSGVSLLGFPVQDFTTNNTFTLNVSADCSRNFTSASNFFSSNYALTRSNGLFLRDCHTSDTSPCVLPTSAVSQMSHSLSCNSKGDNLTCLYNNTGTSTYLSKYDVVNKSTCQNLFSSVMYESNLAVFALGSVEIGWWMNGDCRCAANATCKRVSRTDGVEDGYWCNCDAGFTGDGYVNGTGCRREHPKCNSRDGSCKNNRIAAIAGGSAAGATLAALLFLCILCWRRYGKSCSLNEYQITTQKLLSDISCTLPIYSYREIERATNSFAEANKLGTGGYGTVYVGKLLLQNNSTEDLVAIKRIRYRADPDSINQLTNEIKLISSVSHPNLVQLLGCCIDNGEQILIYEYMPNGTLSYHLHPDHGHGAPLSWALRVAIASDTAKAIAYLHNSLHPPIYHRDIKSSNILLDRDFNPKVADFGLSRAARTEMSHISTAPQGTPGYLDPEYHQNFHLSDKSDVYSFGVVLIEIVTAMKVVDFSRGPSEVNLASLAVDRIGRGRIEEILDPFLVRSGNSDDEWVMDSIRKMAELAFRCLAFSKDVRPGMSEVAEELERIRAAIPDSESDPLDNGELDYMGRNNNEEHGLVSSYNYSTGRTKERKSDSPVSVQYVWVSEHSSYSTNGSMPRLS